MKTEMEWNQDILNVTMRIHQEFPELSKFIKEIPVKALEKDNHAKNIKNLREYYNSLVELLEEYSKTHNPKKAKNRVEKVEKLAVPGYPLYPPNEDIYNQAKKEMGLKPGDLSKNKAPNEKEGTRNEKDFKEDCLVMI